MKHRSLASLSLALLLVLVGCGDAPTRDPAVALSPEAEGWVETMLTSEDSDERIAAHKKLAALGAVVVPRMIAILDADAGNEGTGAWAAEVLILLGPAAEPAAAALAQQLMETTVCNATTATALAGIGKPAVPHLIRALSAKIPAARQWAADALGDVAEHAGAATPALVGLLDDSNEGVRSAVLYALRDLGPAAHPRATAPLLALLSSDDEVVRADVVAALAAAATDAEVRKRLEALAKDDPDDYVRESAREALQGD